MQVLTASWDNTSRLWDMRTGKPLSEVMVHGDNVTSAQFSPDGTQLVIAAHEIANCAFSILASRWGEPIKHQDSVWDTQFSPDGMQILIVSGNTVRLWDTHTGKSLGGIMAHPDQVRSAQLSP